MCIYIYIIAGLSPCGLEIISLQLQVHQSFFTEHHCNALKMQQKRCEGFCHPPLLLCAIISLCFVYRTNDMTGILFLCYKLMWRSWFLHREQQLSGFVFEWWTLWGETPGSPASVCLICLQSLHIFLPCPLLSTDIIIFLTKTDELNITF